MIAGKFINDAAYNVSKYTPRQPGVKQKQLWKCPIYAKWEKMILRVSTISGLEKNPSYKNVSICDEWIYFSNFRNWVLSQNIHPDDYSQLDLDKDLKNKNSFVYSPDTCLFIPRYINCALSLNGDKNKNGISVGVQQRIHKTKISYRAYINKFRKRMIIGTYDNEADAHLAWQNEKIIFFREMINKYKTERYYNIEVELCLKNIISKLQYEMDNKLTTKTLG